jgi:hypothetical protein
VQVEIQPVRPEHAERLRALRVAPEVGLSPTRMRATPTLVV